MTFIFDFVLFNVCKIFFQSSKGSVNLSGFLKLGYEFAIAKIVHFRIFFLTVG